MKWARWSLIVILMNVFPPNNAHGQTARSDGAATVRQAVQRALPLLQQSARTWTEKGGCFSCHHQGLGATAIALAKERGFNIDDAMFAAEIAAIRDQLDPPPVNVTFTLPNIDYLDKSYALVALAAGGVGNDDVIDSTVHVLLGSQHVSGHWTPYPLRLPLEGSHFAQTAWTIRALRLFTPPARRSEVERRVRRGVDWLTQAAAKETADLAMQMLGIAWGGGPTESLRRATGQLLALQRPDGGWGQIASRPSDAYVTGLALVALNQGGRVAATSAPYQQGLAFLTRTQQADGSWLVETRRTWKQGLRYFETGFPHGKHQFISFAGSAWAVMALALGTHDGVSPIFVGNPRRTSSATSTGGQARPQLTPLVRAALLGTLEELRSLVRSGMDVNAVSSPDGLTALTAAVHDPAKVKLLIYAGAQVEAATFNGHTPLLIAADYDDAYESVRLLLERGANVHGRTSRPPRMNTPLARATLRGDRRVVELLLQHGVSLNEEPSGSSALLAAINHEDAALVTLLLDRGARVESQPPAGSRDAAPGSTPLMWAADRSDVAIVRLLLARGARVNATDSRGMTPLLYAAGAINRGTALVVEALLAAGADPSVRSQEGDTALDFAVRYGNVDAVALLRKAASPAAAR